MGAGRGGLQEILVAPQDLQLSKFHLRNSAFSAACSSQALSIFAYR